MKVIDPAFAGSFKIQSFMLKPENFFAYFQKTFNLVEGTEGWYRFTDPFDVKAHYKKDRTMAVNFQEMRVRSFRSEYKSSINNFLMKYEGISFFDIPEFLEPFGECYLPIVSKKLLYYEAPKLDLPKNFVVIGSGTDLFAQKAVDYMVGRGFDITYLVGKNIGYCKYGELGGYLCFPFYDKKGELEFYVLRDFIGGNPRRPKYKNLKAGTTKKTAGQVVYNSSRLNYKGDVFVTEGIIDSLTLGDDSVATIGKEVTPYQMSLLSEAGASRFIVMGDPKALTHNLINFGRLALLKEVLIVDFTPLGGDVNQVGKEAALEHAKATAKNLNDFLI